MQQHISPADHRENAFKLFSLDRAVFELAFLGAGQGRGGAALVGLLLELGQGNSQQAHQIVETQGPVDPVNVFRFDGGAFHQQLHHRFRHLIGHLQPHHLAAAAAFA